MDSQNPYILILVAQPPIRAKLNLNAHTPLRQRIQVNATLRGLSEEELANYLSTRLAFAGNDEQIFQAQSISAIYSVSNGLPPGSEQFGNKLPYLRLSTRGKICRRRMCLPGRK